jgi:DNA-binding beta-propeller fold protein YncE
MPMRRAHLVLAAAVLIGSLGFVAESPTAQSVSASASSSAATRRSAAFPRVVLVGQNPRDLAVSEQTHHVFVASAGAFDYTTGRYAANGTVSMLDARTGSFLRRVTVGKGPSTVVVDDRAGRVLVVNGGDQSTGFVGSVSFLNTHTGARLKTVVVGQQPSKLIVDVRTWRAFVLTSAFPPARKPTDGEVKVLAITRGIVIRSEPIGTHPEALAFDSKTNAVFALAGAGEITVLSGASGQLIGTLGRLAQGAPLAIAVDSKTGRLFSASSGDSHGGQGAITTLDDRTGKVVHSVIEDVARGADWLLVDEPANRVLAGESTSGAFRNPDVAVLDAKRGTVLHRLNLNFSGSALDQKTGKIYFTSSSRTIKVLNPYGWRIVETIHLARDAGAMIVTQNTRRLFITNPNNGSVTAL